MNLCGCGKNGKKEKFLPKQVVNLKKDPKFKYLSDGELLNYFEQYNIISKGNKYLTKKDFHKILLAFNVI